MRENDPTSARRPPEAVVDSFLWTACAVVVGCSIYAVRNEDPDLWGHLAYGRWFATHGIFGGDPFSFSTSGETWFRHEYLAQLVLWWSYAAAGAFGLIALKCALGGATFAALHRGVRLSRADARIAAPALMLAACLISGYLFFRPQLFTYAFFAAFTFILLAHLLGDPARLAWLPVLTVVWANLHGGFIAGIALVAQTFGLSYLMDALDRPTMIPVGSSATRRLGAVLVACCIASLATPLTWTVWPFLVTELRNPYNHRFIAEWQPVRLLPPDWIGFLVLVLLAVTALAAWTADPKMLRGRFRRSAWVLSVVPLAVLAIRSHRHVPLLVLWTIPVLVVLASATNRRAHISSVRPTVVLVATFVVGTAASLQVIAVVHDPAPIIRIDTQGRGAPPSGAVSFLEQNHLAGRLFTPLWWGSFVSWKLYPAVLVSCDGRNDTLYAVEQVGENLRFYATADADVDAPIRSGAEMLLVPAWSPVLTRLREDERWRLLYDDDEAALFVRSDERHADVIDRARTNGLSMPPRGPAGFLE